MIDYALRKRSIADAVRQWYRETDEICRSESWIGAECVRRLELIVASLRAAIRTLDECGRECDHDKRLRWLKAYMARYVNVLQGYIDFARLANAVNIN
jgi:hypothetical protein